MKIDLLKTKVYLISPGTGKYLDRLNVVFGRLVKYGFFNIEFVRSVPDVSSTNSLSLTNLEILKKEMDSDKPFIIFEDDIEFSRHITEIDVPDDASAVYLGVSKWVYPHPYDTLLKPNFQIIENNICNIKDYDDDLTQIAGVTSTHGILFKDRKYIRKFIDNMQPVMERCVAHDLVFATIHQEYTVYALKDPIVYQDAAIGGQEEATRLTYNGVNYC